MEDNKSWISQLVFTLVFWACFLMLPFIFFPHNPSRPAFESKRFIALYIFSNLYLVGFYYFNSGVLIPKLLAKRKAGLYFLSILFFFLIYLAAFYWMWNSSVETINFFKEHPRMFKRRNWLYNFFSLGPIMMFLLAFTFSSVSKIVARWFYAERVKEEISKQQLETELSLLRSQVNPHFLFNTLNSIYSLTLTNSEKAPDAVMRLSRIMRYTLEEAQSEFVPLEDELAFINSYLELQKIRATDKVQVLYEVKGNDGDIKIPPLLLIPFIENAFKYGVSARNRTVIKVIIKVENKFLFFNCENDIVPNIAMHQGTGLGIANVRRRLELLYKRNYTLDIINSDDKYKVALHLEIS
ncbi:sensor histidine kinase [Arachidicoccus soli]|uniref:Signal transduction histidine kinase internal region domain-containing protein n=1 Tax=Arachidicoccus soli TaxID=2341117 RepID=A0A386HN88_9BACT|nr:histidine kinase [Arachidicoccus soli]AYD46980.1 hypothetical protein D6B99_04745 [Arachidicoccus soli]